MYYNYLNKFCLNNSLYLTNWAVYHNCISSLPLVCFYHPSKELEKSSVTNRASNFLYLYIWYHTDYINLAEEMLGSGPCLTVTGEGPGDPVLP